MSFFQEYKQLDIYCRDALGTDRGVSAYLEEMERLPMGERFVTGWKNDYYQLKHCRWARNKLAHEDVSENEVCKPGDMEWVVSFYKRMLNQTDPLALYAERLHTKKTAVGQSAIGGNCMPASRRRRKRKASILPECIGMFIAVLIMLYVLKMMGIL